MGSTVSGANQTAPWAPGGHCLPKARGPGGPAPGVVAAGDGVHGPGPGESAARLAPGLQPGLAWFPPLVPGNPLPLPAAPVGAARSAGSSTPGPGLRGRSRPPPREPGGTASERGGGPPPSSNQPIRPPRRPAAPVPARDRAAAAVEAPDAARTSARCPGPDPPALQRRTPAQTDRSEYLPRERGARTNTPAD